MDDQDARVVHRRQYFHFMSKLHPGVLCICLLISHRDEPVEGGKVSSKAEKITDESTEKKFGPLARFSKSPTHYRQLQPAAKGAREC